MCKVAIPPWKPLCDDCMLLLASSLQRFISGGVGGGKGGREGERGEGRRGMGLRWDFSRVYGFSPKEFSPRITAPQRWLEAAFSNADSSNDQAARLDTAIPLSAPRVGGNGFGVVGGGKRQREETRWGKGGGEGREKEKTEGKHEKSQSRYLLGPKSPGRGHGGSPWR